MKLKALLALGLSVALFTGCSSSEETNTNDDTDVVTAATQTIVEDEANLVEGIGENGSWIIIFEDDLTVDAELVVEGEFINKEKVARKLALYAQDADRNITDRYTLTAPSVTVKSENLKVKGGTIAGDVYVEANGFYLDDATVEGNVYFASEEVKESADLSGGTVTGTVEVEGAVDVVTGATQTIVVDEASLVTGTSANGSWIIIMQQDLEVSDAVVVEGEFTNRDEVARKLAFYDQDADRNITDRYTLTAPSVTVKSENLKVKGGTIAGDVYVEANGFYLDDATVEGNVYFASEEVKESADLSGGTVTGTVEVQ